MKRYILSIMAVGAVAAAMAVPAKKGTIQYTQPDGTVVNVTLRGDEHAHAAFAEDGSLLVSNGEWLEYAKFNADGDPKPSGVRAGGATFYSIRSLQTPEQVQGWMRRLESHREVRLDAIQGNAMMRSASRAAEADDGGDRVVPMNFGLCSTTFPTTGSPKGLVIVVEYPDYPLKYADSEYFSRLLNEEGFSDHGSPGSARDWFIHNSNGLFTPDFDVYGPVTLPFNRKYYGENDAYGNDMRAHEMAIHACDILDDEVDFSQYDTDGDGYVDNVFIFYAEKGEHDSGIDNAVWPHSYDISSADPYNKYVYDGVRLDHYACSSEYVTGFRRPDGYGTFVHEFSHVIGLPDLYVTNYSSGFTPDTYSVMDYGSYNNDGLTPPYYSSYERCALGWIDFRLLEPGEIEIPNLSGTNVAYALPTEKKNEFFFFENRQQVGNDVFIPGHGMLVWHIDYNRNKWDSNTVNNTSSHQNVDIVEADDKKTDYTRNGDTFPGVSGVTEFGPETTPALVSWAKKDLGVALTGITETSDGMITFTCRSTDDSAVGIVGAETADDVYFDLMGRRVMNPGKGIFIKDGKKIIL